MTGILDIHYTIYFIFLRPWNDRGARNCALFGGLFCALFGGSFGGSFGVSVCVILLRRHKAPSSPPGLPLFFATETQTAAAAAAAAAAAEYTLVRPQKRH